MIRPRKILFVITDGGHARFVDYGAETESFVTIGNMDLNHALQSPLLGDVLTVHSEGDQHIRGSEAHVREVHEAFAHAVSKSARTLASKGDFSEVFIAAPARLLGLIRDDLAKQFQIAGTASKDLTKVGDHDLAKWLKSALFAAG